MKIFSRSRKGNVISDVLLWLVILFILVIVIVVGKLLFTGINTDIQSDDSLSTENKERIDTAYNNYSGFWDKAFLLIIVLLTILVIVASFMIDTRPIFFAVVLILIFIVVFVGASLSNSYEELGEGDSELETAINSFPIINFFMKHIVKYIIVVAFLVALALYGKSKIG